MRLRLGQLGPEGSTFAKFLASAAVLATVLGGWLLTENLGAAKAEPVSLPDSIHRDGDCDLWFVGSSSIARWATLGRDMAPWAAHNRGISGANLEEIRRRFAAEPAGRQPQAIILYAGENDIAFGASAAQAVAGFEAFVEEKRRRYGALPTIVISVKPSPMRRANVADQTVYNSETRRLATDSTDLTYVDIVPRLMVDGHLGDFYMPDGIHMSPAGYRRWVEPIRQALEKIAARRRSVDAQPIEPSVVDLPSRPAPPARIEGLDAWRALLMLGGILTHGTILREADPVFEAIVLVSASFRVGAFFMLSGLLSGFALERRRPADWLCNRLVRIGVPTIFALTVICPSTSLLLMETLDPAAAGNVLLCDWYHIWFLVALLLYTVMLVPVIRIDRRLGLFAALDRRYAAMRSIQVPLLLTVGSLSLLLMAGTTELISAFCGDHYQPMMVQTRLMVGYAPLYLLGFAFGRCAELRRAALGCKGPALAILACLVLLEAAWLGGGLDRLTATNRESCGTLITLFGAAFGPPAAFVLIWRSSVSIRQVPERLKRLADASFTIYVIHFPLIVGINLALMHVDWNIYAEYAVAVVASAVLSYGLHRLAVRRSGVLSLLFNGRPSPCPSKAAIGAAMHPSRVAA